MALPGVIGTRYTRGEAERNRMADKGFAQILAESLAAGLGSGLGSGLGQAGPNLLVDWASGRMAQREAETKGTEARTKDTEAATIAQELANAYQRGTQTARMQQAIAEGRLGRDKAVAARDLIQPQTEFERAKIASGMGDLGSYERQRGLRDAATVGGLQQQAAASALDILLRGGEPSAALYKAMGAGYPDDILQSPMGESAQWGTEKNAADVMLTQAQEENLRRRTQAIGEDQDLRKMMMKLRMNAARARAKSSAVGADPVDAFRTYMSKMNTREVNKGGEVELIVDAADLLVAQNMFGDIAAQVEDMRASGQPIPKKMERFLKLFGTQNAEGDWLFDTEKLSKKLKKSVSPDAAAMAKERAKLAEEAAAREERKIQMMGELGDKLSSGARGGDITVE